MSDSDIIILIDNDASDGGGALRIRIDNNVGPSKKVDDQLREISVNKRGAYS